MKKSESHRIRARIPHFEENEPNLSYYARMEKIKSEGNTIQSLYDKNGIQQGETSQILKITENYCSNLFRAGKQISNTNQSGKNNEVSVIKNLN